MSGSAPRTRVIAPLVFAVAFASPAPAFAASLRAPRVDPQLGSATVFHVARAAARLGRPGCAAVLEDFTGVETGRPLSSRLVTSGVSPREFLSRLTYRKAPPRGPCARSDVLAYTSPGSLVIWVCADTFEEIEARDDALASSILIHETLHSLGLGENPPTSAEITERVRERCGW